MFNYDGQNYSIKYYKLSRDKGGGVAFVQFHNYNGNGVPVGYHDRTHVVQVMAARLVSPRGAIWRNVGCLFDRRFQTTASAKEEKFEEIFRKSNFIAAGDPIQDINVRGSVLAIVDDNLYVDVGGKFHAVVTAPKQRKRVYQVGSHVIVRLKNLEMTSHFLGDSKDTSLLEAEAELLGPAEPPRNRAK